MGVGGGLGVAQDTGNGGRRWGEALIRCVGGRRGDADDGSGEILFPTVELQVTGLGVQTGTTGETQKTAFLFLKRKGRRNSAARSSTHGTADF